MSCMRPSSSSGQRLWDCRGTREGKRPKAAFCTGGRVPAHTSKLQAWCCLNPCLKRMAFVATVYALEMIRGSCSQKHGCCVKQVVAIHIQRMQFVWPIRLASQYKWHRRQNSMLPYVTSCFSTWYVSTSMYNKVIKCSRYIGWARTRQYLKGMCRLVIFGIVIQPSKCLILTEAGHRGHTSAWWMCGLTMYLTTTEETGYLQEPAGHLHCMDYSKTC